MSNVGIESKVALAVAATIELFKLPEAQRAEKTRQIFSFLKGIGED